MQPLIVHTITHICLLHYFTNFRLLYICDWGTNSTYFGIALEDIEKPALR